MRKSAQGFLYVLTAKGTIVVHKDYPEVIMRETTRIMAVKNIDFNIARRKVHLQGQKKSQPLYLTSHDNFPPLGCVFTWRYDAASK